MFSKYIQIYSLNTINTKAKTQEIVKEPYNFEQQAQKKRAGI